MSEQEVIFPAYMKDFSCIGSACEESCCIGWTVTVDKLTFLNYKKNEKLKKMFDIYVERDVMAKTDKQYAKIKMDEKIVCPFLDEQRLCCIQREHGFEALSVKCMTYPRHYIRINKRTEMSATLSCPEVASLALLSPDGIAFISESLFLHEKVDYVLNSEFDNVKVESEDQCPSAIKNFFNIQATSIAILQCRELSLEKRMMLLGVFSKKLFECKDGDEEIIIQAFDRTDVLIAHSRQFDKHQPQYMPQIVFLSDMMLNAMKTASSIHKKYVNNLIKAITALFGTGTDYEIMSNYANIGIPKYQEFIKERSYVVENYLVNSLYEQSFPISTNDPKFDGNDIFLGYMTFVVKFVVLKAMIIGLLMSGETLDDVEIVSLIQTYTKGMHHNKDAIDSALVKIRENGNYRLEGIILLLNN